MRHWASRPRPTGPDEAEDDAAHAGIDLTEAVPPEPEHFPLLEDNAHPLSVFLRMQSQLTSSGFRYEGLEAGLRLAGVEPSSALFEDLVVMERAFVEYVAEVNRD